MREIMYLDVDYKCPICGKEIKKVKISKEYIRCFNKDKVNYALYYTCDCYNKIQEIIDWYNQIKEEFSEINILNRFAEASNKAYEQALKNIGIEKEE